MHLRCMVTISPPGGDFAGPADSLFKSPTVSLSEGWLGFRSEPDWRKPQGSRRKGSLSGSLRPMAGPTPSSGLAGLEIVEHPPDAVGFAPFHQLERRTSAKGRVGTLQP